MVFFDIITVKKVKHSLEHVWHLHGIGHRDAVHELDLWPPPPAVPRVPVGLHHAVRKVHHHAGRAAEGLEVEEQPALLAFAVMKRFELTRPFLFSLSYLLNS